MSDDLSNSTNIRGKDWIYNCLWATARDASNATCPINIPVTFIFRDGLPLKALQTNDKGVVSRLSLDPSMYEDITHASPASSIASSSSSGGGLKGQAYAKLRTLRNILFLYSRDEGYDVYQAEQGRSGELMNICTTYYSDGEKEDITVRSFDILVKNENWRSQVLMIQGFIPSLSDQKGYYYQTPRVRSLLQTDNAAAADKYTKALARFAENAYTFNTGTILDDIGVKLEGKTKEKDVKLKMKEMICNFRLDCNDKVLFTAADSTMVEIHGVRQEVENYIHDEKAGREASAAEGVSTELLKLLRHAKRRGLPTMESFQHFDTNRIGYINADMMTDGLARLGIGVVYTVAEKLIEIISGIGSGFVTLQDFDRYIRDAPDIEGFENAFNDMESLEASSVTSIEMDGSIDESQAGEGKKKQKKKRTASSLPSNVVPESKLLPLSASQDDVISQEEQTKLGLTPINDELYKVEEEVESKHSPRGRNEGFLGGGMNGVLYGVDKTAKTAKDREDKDMNSLSSKRNRRALKELRRTQEKWLKVSENKKREEALGDGENSGERNDLDSGGQVQPMSPSGKRKLPPVKSTTSSPTAKMTNKSGSKKPQVKKLDLNGIYTEIQTSHDTVKSDDLVLHIENGLVMTYRIMVGAGPSKVIKTKEQRDDLRYASILRVREKNLAKFEADRLKERVAEGDFAYINAPPPEPKMSLEEEAKKAVDREVSFTLVVLPGLFMTLDTLQDALKQLLHKYPHCRIILVGYPGLPNTHWPRGWVLNSDLQARSTAKLLTFLRDTRKLQVSPGMPIFIMSFGTSSLPLIKFVNNFLPGLDKIKTDVKAVILVNSILKVTSAFKKMATDFRTALANAGSHEVNELVCSIHFWDDYLRSVGREEAMTSFWKSRRELCSDNFNEEYAGAGYIGALEMLRALLVEPDSNDDVVFMSSDMPIFAVQSTEDIFVHPKYAARFQKDNLPSNRKIADDFSSALHPGAVHVSWLKAGHEIIQERRPYILAVVSKLAQLAGIYPDTSEDAWDPKPLHEQEDDNEMYDLMEAAARRRQKEEDDRIAEEKARVERIKAEQRAKMDAAALAKLEAEEQAEKEAAEARERAREEERLRKEEEKRLAEEERQKQLKIAEEEEKEAQLAAEKEQAAREAREKEKEKRAILARERKKRELMQARRAEMEALYERERVQKEAKNEARERLKMEKEDFRSRKAAEYAVYLKQVQDSSVRAKRRKEQMDLAKKEEAIRKVEEEIAMKRAIRLEERRKKSEEVAKKLSEEEFVMAGGMDYDLSPNEADPPTAIIISTQRMIKDLHVIRARTVEVIKRQKLVEEKTNLFREQCTSVKNDTARLRRAIQMIKVNPSVLGANVDPEQEIKSLEDNLRSKEETYQELRVLAKGRDAQLSAVNKAVQDMKSLVADINEKWKNRLEDIYKMEAKYAKIIKGFKEDREDAIVDVDKCKLEIITLNKRIKLVENEYERIRNHKEEFVDSAVWIPGVMQRVKTKEMKKFLKSESKLERGKVAEIEEKMNKMKEDILDMQIRQDKAKRDCDKMSMAAKIFGRTFREIEAQPIIELVESLHTSQTGAEELEQKRVKDRQDINKTQLKSSEGMTSVDMVRMKDHEIRNKDERRFVGYDIVMNPDKYTHLSVAEIEEMHFDPDYNTDLTAADLNKIKKLPDQINLALPFLHTPSEVEAHRILNKYEKDLDEDTFVRKDFASDGTVSEEENTAGVTANDLVNAEVVHDILVREIRRDRIRAKGEGEEFTEEEKDWMKIDHIISPHVFGLDEKKKIPPDVEMLYGSIAPGPMDGVFEAGPNSKKINQNYDERFSAQNALEYPLKVERISENRDGDKYQEMRWRYENGEVVFDDSWKCPFYRDDLLRIAKTQIDLLETEDEKYAKKLLDRFYVSDDESTLGKRRLDEAAAVSKEMLKALKNIEWDNPNFQSEREKAEEEERKRKDAEQQEEDDQRRVVRVWGGWDTVHPASAGTESQVGLFMISSYAPSRDHPGSFAIYEDSGVNIKLRRKLDDDSSVANSDGGKVNRPSDEEMSRLGKQAIISMPLAKPANLDSFRNDPKSKYFIVDGIPELTTVEARRVKGKIILIGKGEQITVSEVEEQRLDSRQSRSHRFELPDRQDARILDITVSVLFQGAFTTKGYGLGRIAAALFRLPDDNDPNASPVPAPVGFSPYIMQSPNLPDQMGRIVIMHRPASRPLPPASYQIVVGAASSTKYSIIVTCRVAQAALPLVDEAIAVARGQQARLPLCLKELEVLDESLMIAERKLNVCDKMIAEAELESKRAQENIFAINKKLAEDDKYMTMLDDERRELVNELGICEVEFAQAANTFTSRFQEKDDIKGGIKLMHKFQRERQHEKIKIKADLVVARRDLPACMVLLRSLFEAVNVASSLNTTVQAIAGPGEAVKKDAVPVMLTPAEEVRRTYKQKGWKALSIEEQQWCIMDQALRSEKYDWLREKEEEEAAERIARGKKPKKQKLKKSVELFRSTKLELEHLLVQPLAALTRHEMIQRKLLRKFHDDPEIQKRAMQNAAFGFDPHAAERTRAKDAHAYTKEEANWASVDRKLHPEVWKFYSHHDPQKSFMDKNKSASTVDNKPKLSEGQQKQLTALSNILHVDADVGVNMADAASATMKAIEKKGNLSHVWSCPFEKDEIMKIWSAPKQQLKTDDERLTRKLLEKYNGNYKDYIIAQAERDARNANAARAGEHINFNKFGGVAPSDVDLRCRLVLKEIERAKNCKVEYMDTQVLHANDQRFPTSVVRMMLEEELDALLREQIMERERNDRARIHDDSESEDENEVASDESEYDEGGEDIIMLKKLQKRAAKRERRRQRLKQDDEKSQVHKTRKLVSTASKSAEALELAKLQNELGVTGCLACRSKKCKWEGSCDMDALSARLKELSEEVNRVRQLKDEPTVESTVALSAQLGGNTFFKRLELLDELTTEADDLTKRIELDNIDWELHESYNTRGEYMEVKFLHGYSMVLWTNNARKALENRRNRLIALTIANDVVNDILDYMLEGWYFGEMESKFSVAGKVPSIKPQGAIRSGQDQISASQVAAAKAKKRREDKKKGIVTDQSKQGTRSEKNAPIEAAAIAERKRLKVARDGNEHEHMLNETENTLRFGLFMLSLMYFRAMTYLKRDKAAFSGEDEEIAGKKAGEKVMTDERMRMLDEEQKANARKKKVDTILAKAKIGEARRQEREAAERKEAVLRIQAIVRRQKLEAQSIGTIQRYYRGHLGRKAALRWALKKAEIGAINALLNAAAIFIQRIYRGYLARVEAIETRAQMAQFIALMRAQEAAEDEEQYWDTHPYSRFKRNAKAWIDSKFRKDQASTLLGASSLTKEEQEELEFEENVIDDGDSDEDNEAADSDDGDAGGSSVVSGLTKEG